MKEFLASQYFKDYCNEVEAVGGFFNSITELFKSLDIEYSSISEYDLEALLIHEKKLTNTDAETIINLIYAEGLEYTSLFEVEKLRKRRYSLTFDKYYDLFENQA